MLGSYDEPSNRGSKQDIRPPSQDQPKPEIMAADQKKPQDSSEKSEPLSINKNLNHLKKKSIDLSKRKDSSKKLEPLPIAKPIKEEPIKEEPKPISLQEDRDMPQENPQPLAALATSLFQSSVPSVQAIKKIQKYDQNSAKVLKAFTLILMGDDQSLPMPKGKFLLEFIPETFMQQIRRQHDFDNMKDDPNAVYDVLSRELNFKFFPLKHTFAKDLQVIFMLDSLDDEEENNDQDFLGDGDQDKEKKKKVKQRFTEEDYKRLSREDAGAIWFCQSNNQPSLEYLEKEYSEGLNILKSIPTICIMVLESEPKEFEEKFKENLEKFAKKVKANTMKFNINNNTKPIYEKFKKFLINYLSEIQAENREKVAKLKELTNLNPKLDRLLLNDLAFLFTANQGIIPFDVLEKRAFLMMGRPNDLLYSQFKKILEPYLEKYKQLFQKSYEDNICKPTRSKALRPPRRNLVVGDQVSTGKLIFTEAEVKDLIKEYCEYVHFNGLKAPKKLNKEGLLRNSQKESKSAMHINVDARFKAILGFPSNEDFQEIKNFLEKSSTKEKEKLSKDYEEILSRRHKTLKPKGLYKSFDPLKRDFHGQDISKLVAKESLDQLAEYLLRKNSLEKPNPQDLKLLTGFIGLKENKHMEKKIARMTQTLTELKNTQKINISQIESFREKVKTEELLGNLNKIRKDACFEEWGLIYVKSCEFCSEAVEALKIKYPKLIKKIVLPGGFKKSIRLNLIEFNEDSREIMKKISKAKRLFLIVCEKYPSDVDQMRRFIEREVLIPKKSHSLQRMQLLILFFCSPNSHIIESFESYLQSVAHKVNITLQEEPLLSIKSYFEYQFFTKLEKYYEKQAVKPKNQEEVKPSLEGIVPQTKNAALSYESFLEMLSGRLFPGEALNRELMDELFQGWFNKHESNFDAIDFNKLYQKTLKKLDRIISMVNEKMINLRKKEKELQISLERLKQNEVQEVFFAVKIEEFSGIHELLYKKKKLLLEFQYGTEKMTGGKLNFAKSLVVNEKYLLPFVQDEDFLIRFVQTEEKTNLEGLTFVLKLKDQKTEESGLGIIQETTLQPETENPDLKSIGLKVKFKKLVYSEERAMLKIRKFEDIIKNFTDYLIVIYRYKYDLLELFAPKSSVNAEFLSNHMSFLENIEINKPTKEPPKEIPVYEEELQLINQELNNQTNLIKELEKQQNNDKSQQQALEAEINKLQTLMQGLKEENSKEKAAYEAEIQRKKLFLEEFNKTQALSAKKIEALQQIVLDIQQNLAQKQNEKQVVLDKRGEIVAFFTTGKNSGYPEDKLRRLQEYFLYLQKSILKFYSKAVIVEADVFEMKSSSLKAGLGCLAGSVPFIGNLLKFVVETAVDLKKKWDENKFVRKCLKFSTLIHSQRILAEITEEVAFEIIKDPKKQELIMEASEMKTSTLELLKQKLMEFFKKAKDYFTRSKKSKTQEKLLKDLDTPAKLLGNIDGGYLCTQAIEVYKQEHMNFDPGDPYNKKGIVKLFITVINSIPHSMYEKVIGFEEMKDFKGVLEVSEETIKEKIAATVTEPEPTHEEIKAVVLEDPATLKKIQETNEELAIFKERQENNEKKLRELLEEHNLQHQDLENHEKRINALEKQATLGLNFLGGLNQEVSDVKERVENLYNMMNVKYQDILKKFEEGIKVESSMEGSGLLKKLKGTEKLDSNDPFLMYLDNKGGSLKLKGSSGGLRTPNKQILTPLLKKQ